MRAAQVLLLTTLIPAAIAADRIGQPAEDLSLRLEVQRAIDKGLDWMERHQAAEGYWSTPDHPALTALPLVALKGDPSAKAREEEKRCEVVRKGYQFLLDSIQPDGGIYRKEELPNYNTAVSVMALTLRGEAGDDEIIRRARKRIIQNQWGPETSDRTLAGGIGYGNDRRAADLSNTMHALEALYYSRRFEHDQAHPENDLNWEAALEFIENCQHLPKYNEMDWVSTNEANFGGFVYSPKASKAGEVKENGRTALRAYGSISYAGMLSYIYAGLTPEDPRVKAVLDWLARNYTLEENPGMGQQGYYFYVHTMAKALTAAGQPVLAAENGKDHDWRKEVALRLINLQKQDGSWVNDNGRWWENDPVLVTSYAVIALELIHRGL